ncbi:MAG TPA: NADH-quinone oxidoreductase subunit C [Gammaproteobacteria bacterium]|nr:NADH-quinone oxidoreductase subunit C [Gammaproteobacteria bacterium]
MVNKKYEQLNDLIDQYLNSFEIVKTNDGTSITLELKKDDLIEICSLLKNTEALNFSMLIDVCGIDYLHYGVGDWETTKATTSGYSRAVQQNTIIPDPDEKYQEKRFAVIYHLLSIDKNWRIRLKTFTGSENPPIVQSVTGIWNSADWFEREAFDLFGIYFDGHPDLRRILTDYGFIGHPFRKDFPLAGNLEVFHDDLEQKVKYRPVSITTRPTVPKVIRKKKNS